jgi:hypothetical protein
VQHLTHPPRLGHREDTYTLSLQQTSFPFTFASETFEPLFSHFSSTNSAYDCLSATTGLTNFIEAMSSDHPDPYQLDTPFVPQPTDGTLDPIHHMPFLQHYSDLDTRTNPNAALLYYPDATLQDNINGPLTMQHLPACVDISITAATFCLRYITANLATKECIKDLTADHLRHFFRELHPVLLVNAATISDNDDSIEYIQCMQHTLNRTTNLDMDNLPNEMLHHFPHGTPASYLSLLNDHQPGSLGHECALAILYALKTLHLIHFLTFPATLNAPYKHMTHDLSDIIRNVPSFATTLSLFPNRSNFRDAPAFIHTFFQDQQVATNPFDRRQDSQQSSYNDQPLHLGSSFLIASTHHHS